MTCPILTSGPTTKVENLKVVELVVLFLLKCTLYVVSRDVTNIRFGIRYSDYLAIFCYSELFGRKFSAE